MKLAAAVVAVCLPILCGVAGASTYSELFSFGDSNADSGRRFQLQGRPLPPYYQGRHSNGPVAVEILAANLGVPLTNFAVGGAFSGHGNIDPSSVLAQTGLLDQGVTFASSRGGGQADPDALYSIWVGPNDFSALGTNPTGAQVAATTASVIANTQSFLQSLSDLGARHFFVVDRYGGVGVDSFNAGLQSAMQSLDVALPGDIVFFDVRAPVLAMRSPTNPYGFTHLLGSDPCFLGTLTSGGSACADPEHYVTWDNAGHLTARAHAILGAAMTSAVPEPGSLPLMALGLCALLLGTGWKRFSRASRR